MVIIFGEEQVPLRSCPFLSLPWQIQTHTICCPRIHAVPKSLMSLWNPNPSHDIWYIINTSKLWRDGSDRTTFIIIFIHLLKRAKLNIYVFVWTGAQFHVLKCLTTVSRTELLAGSTGTAPFPFLPFLNASSEEQDATQKVRLRVLA